MCVYVGVCVAPPVAPPPQHLVTVDGTYSWRLAAVIHCMINSLLVYKSTLLLSVSSDRPVP